MTNPLLKLLRLEDLQQVQDSFAKVLNMGVALVDTQGKPITRPSGDGLAVLVPDTPSGQKQNQAVYRKLCQENRISKRPATTTSPATGLITGAVPVMLGSQYVASWIVGQLLPDPANSTIILGALMACGLAEPAAKKLMDTLPRLSRKEQEARFAFLEEMTLVLTQIARGRYDLEVANVRLTALTEQLDSTAQMLTKLTNSADVGLYVTDFFTGEVLQGNEQFFKFAGRTIESLIGKACWKQRDETLESFCPGCPHDRLLDEKGDPLPPVVLELYNARADTWTRQAHQAIYWVDGRLAHMVTLTDITQNKKMQQRLAHYAFFDRTLRVPNGLKLAQDAQEWLGGDPVYLICFDIVALRNINDLYGRDTGDALIATICQWVTGMEVTDTTLYRIDGDQFAYAVPRTDLNLVCDLARVIGRRFEEPWSLAIGTQRLSLYCNITLGIVGANSGLSEGEDLLNVIARTLARSGETGKLVVYGQEMNLEYKEQLRLEQNLELCVKHKMEGFSVYYQPIIDPSTGFWCAVEALCRWQSPEFGPVQPLVFIHKAEQLGLITQIGTWVLETAIRECKEMGLDQLEHFLLDVNISPMQISGGQLVPTVIGLLKKYDFPGEKLSLEITESTELNFSPQTIEAIQSLRQHRIQVALDDFGTGYSSLNNLKKLPISILKTERAFLLGIENDSYLQHLFYLMVDLAHAANMTIVAEGVETPEQMQILLKNGVDRLQGYLFARPMPRGELEGKLDRFFRPWMPQAGHVSVGISLEEVLHSQVQLSPHLYRLLGQGMHRMFSGDSAAPKEVLAFIAEQLRLSRAWAYALEEDGSLRRTLEHTAPEIAGLPARLSAQKAAGWVEALRQSGLAAMTDSEALPTALRENMSASSAKATVIFPLWEGSTLLGYMGFDDCLYCREWSLEEAVLLHNISTLVRRDLFRGALPPPPLQSPGFLHHPGPPGEQGSVPRES